MPGWGGEQACGVGVAHAVSMQTVSSDKFALPGGATCTVSTRAKTLA